MLPTMRGRRSGLIINVSSGAVSMEFSAMSIYSASKFALEGFSEAVSYEFATQNIVLKLIQNIKLKRRRNMSAARSFLATSAVNGFHMC